MTGMKKKWKEPTTQKYLDAKAALPEELVPHFVWAVQWYQFYALRIHNTYMISYAVLSEMVKEGFRYEGEAPHTEHMDGKGPAGIR